MTPTAECHTFFCYMSSMKIDDFYKIVLAVVPLLSLIIAPWVQWKITKKQVQMQADIAEQQTKTQSNIANRQIADNISTKRQHWIDELRKDSAEFLTLVGNLQELKRSAIHAAKKPQNNYEDYRERLAIELRAKELNTRIRLRLNPNEQEHNHLVKLIAIMSQKGFVLNKFYNQEQEQVVAADFNNASNAILDHLQTILKHEWERVKKGEV